MHLIHICTAENSVGCWQSYNCNVTGSVYHTKVKVVHKWMFGMLLILFDTNFECTTQSGKPALTGQFLNLKRIR